MATGFTSFGEYDIGSSPSGWVSYDRSQWEAASPPTVEEVSGSLSGRALVHIGGEGRRVGALLWEDGDAFADGEIVCLMRWVDPQAGTGFSLPSWGACFRAVGDDPSSGETSGLGICENSESEHLAITKPSTGWGIPAEALQDGSNLIIVAGTHGYSDGDRVWVRVNFDGEALKIRTWKQGDEEPSEWDIEHTEAGLETQAGHPGYSANTGNNVGDMVIEALGWSSDPAESAPTSGAAGGAANARGRGRGRAGRASPSPSLFGGL